MFFVIFYHFKVPFFEGGFIGVDMFFVISGALITRIILSDLKNNQFSFRLFYQRRIRRIFPALFFVLFISTVIAVFLYDYETLNYYGKSLIAAILFSSNYFFNRNIGYFAFEHEQITLLHTWSLAIEEQFYLFFPVLLYQLKKTAHFKYYLVLFFLFSFILYLVINSFNSNISFYMLPTRAWEFLAGSFLALNLLPSIKNSFNSNLLAFVGSFILLIAITLMTINMKYIIYCTILTVIGTVLIIYSGDNNNQNWVVKILSNPIFTYFGKISYSLYLWHWVLFVFYSYLKFSSFSWSDILVLLVATIIISNISWKFFERPFRYSNDNAIERNVFKSAFLLCLLFLLIGIVIHLTNGLPKRFSDNDLLYNAKNDSLIEFIKNRNKYISSDFEKSPIIFTVGDKNTKPNIIIWGDSHAVVLKKGLEYIASKNKFSCYIASLPGIIALQNVDKLEIGQKYAMSKVSNYILQFIRKHPEINTVVVVGFWSKYYGKNEPKLISVNRNFNCYKQNDFALFKKGFVETFCELKNLKKRIVFVKDVPNLGMSLNKYIGNKRFSLRGFNENNNRTTYEIENKELNNLINFWVKNGYIDEILPLDELFFNGNSIIVEENNQLLYRDENHLSKIGSLKAAQIFEKYFKNSK